ncbi:MAG: hypothetical protein IJO32_02135 [Bacilli bacterium]|nr:hypothetical protein [Bacilli bacterium]
MEMKINEEKAKAFLDDWFEKMRISDEKRKEMFSNTNYIKWLEGFTTKYESFADDSWLYAPTELSQEENEKVANLHLLYEGIELYAKKNYIYPTECDFGGYYNIKLDNIGYEIGMLVGQGTVFFCKRTGIDEELEYIDFNDIMSDKKKDGVDEITQQLKDLSNKVLELHKKGVPLDALIEILDTTLTGIKKEEKNPTKTLKRN